MMLGWQKDGAEAAFVEGAQALGGLPVHVENGGDAGADHFEAAEEGAPVDVVGGEPALHGPDDVVEPLVEGGVVAEAAEEHHGGVAMDVGKRGEQGQAGGVQRLMRREGFRIDPGLDAGKASVLDQDIAGFLAQFGMLNQQVHVLLGAAWLGLCATPAQALLVEVNIGWGYNQDPGGNDLLAYNLQVGSIIQIIMYDSSVAGPPDPANANNNFDIAGNYGGSGLISAPYTTEGIPGEHTPIDTTIYDPNTVPSDI
jgi:hypothetical protein